MSNYSRGANFERAFLQELHSGEDHLYAVRSAGSHGFLDIVEIRRTVNYRELSVWGYQLKTGAKPRLQECEIDYLQFLEESGMNIRVVWRPRRKPRQVFTVEEARAQLSKPTTHRAIRKDAKV